jgi:hypothetical protein
MHTLTRFDLTLAQVLVWGYTFGAGVLAANAQAQKPLYTPGPPVPTAPGSNVPPPVPTAPESSVPPPANEPPPAARRHERKSDKNCIGGECTSEEVRRIAANVAKLLEVLIL